LLTKSVYLTHRSYLLKKQPFFSISTPFDTDTYTLKNSLISKANLFRLFFDLFETWQRFFEFFEKNIFEFFEKHIFEKWTMSNLDPRCTYVRTNVGKNRFKNISLKHAWPRSENCHHAALRWIKNGPVL
jgi:hypothetical protein